MRLQRLPDRRATRTIGVKRTGIPAGRIGLDTDGRLEREQVARSQFTSVDGGHA